MDAQEQLTTQAIQDTLSFWTVTRLRGASASMAYEGSTRIDLLQAFDEVRRRVEEGQSPRSKTERELELEELLTSARAIARRKGENTAWERFDAAIAKAGVGWITAKVFKSSTGTPPSETLQVPAGQPFWVWRVGGAGKILPPVIEYHMELCDAVDEWVVGVEPVEVPQEVGTLKGYE